MWRAKGDRHEIALCEGSDGTVCLKSGGGAVEVLSRLWQSVGRCVEAEGWSVESVKARWCYFISLPANAPSKVGRLQSRCTNALPSTVQQKKGARSGEW